MPRHKTSLTERAIGKLRAPTPTGKQMLHWDADLRGFGVILQPARTRRSPTRRSSATCPGGRTRRVTIAPTNVLSVADARKRAEELLADFYRGIDPRLAGAAAAPPCSRRSTITLPRARTCDREHCQLSHLCRALPDGVAGSAAARDRQEHGRTRHRALQTKVAAGGRYGGKTTANMAMRCLSLLWNYAAGHDEHLPANAFPPSQHGQGMVSVQRRERLVRDDQLPAFYAAVMALPNAVARDYILLMLFTGLRRSEAATLTWDDIDFNTCIIRVPAVRTKANRRLDLPMVDVVRDMLVARQALGRGDYVFLSGSGHISDPGYPLWQVAQATGIRVSAHDLRRTYVTAAESVEISPYALKALINHSMGRDVTSGYVIMTADKLRAPAQRVCDRLKQLCGVAVPGGKVMALKG